MNFDIMKRVLTENLPFSDSQLDKGINEVYSEPISYGDIKRKISLGISHETSSETGNPVYIFNLFNQGEYVNIAGEWTLEEIDEDVIRYLSVLFSIEEMSLWGDKILYQMLARMKADCDYYLGHGNRFSKYLWAKNCKDQIAYMKELWARFPENAKPEWLTMKEIENYEKKMIPNLNLSELNHNMYNLFVMQNEDYTHGVFAMSLDSCLKHTKPEIFEKYRRIDDEAIEAIKQMPAILATVNSEQGRAGQFQSFYLAKITDIVNRVGGCLRVEFETDWKGYRQQLLNEHCKEFGLVYSSLRTELDEIHWAIRQGDILGELKILKGETKSTTHPPRQVGFHA